MEPYLSGTIVWSQDGWASLSPHDLASGIFMIQLELRDGLNAFPLC